MKTKVKDENQEKIVKINKIYIPESSVSVEILNHPKNINTFFKEKSIKKFGFLFDKDKKPIYETYKELVVLKNATTLIPVFSDKEKKNLIRNDQFTYALELQEIEKTVQKQGEYEKKERLYDGVLKVSMSSNDLEIPITLPSGDVIFAKSLSTVKNGILNCYVE